MERGNQTIGVVIVTYNSADVVFDCLDSLARSEGARLHVVVIDNASADRTLDGLRDWRESRAAHDWLDFVKSQVNGGYAHGVNLGIAQLRASQDPDLYWILNPDCRVEPDTARRFAEAGHDGNFALMGGRILYADGGDTIQADGGRVSRLTGRCTSVNQGRKASEATPPAPESLDYISGASCVASRRFLDTAGPMREDYFLYYEEVDWAMRRGTLPLRTEPRAVVRHIGGSSTGSARHRHGGSPFAAYFNYRGRIRFVRLHRPGMVLPAVVYALSKAISLALSGRFSEAHAIVAGSLGLPPPRLVASRLSPSARALAFATQDYMSRR